MFTFPYQSAFLPAHMRRGCAYSSAAEAELAPRPPQLLFLNDLRGRGLAVLCDRCGLRHREEPQCQHDEYRAQEPPEIDVSAR